ncbi:hypothetical protein HDU76_006054 [Blyttiomyces sp. JEL0837]|nr:hypothetical protein HDU76_006054 [Blyttiomyces sp. JEL0837]
MQCVHVLSGHAQAVWAVLGAGSNGVLTASADKLIKRWLNGKCVHTYSGHTDAVRALANIPDMGFVSASNDSTLRVWTYQGDCLNELSAHTSFIYGVTVLPSGEFASCGEDRSVRIWKDNECIQTIQHPCTSVWCVSAMPNGDVVTGGSDGIVRVFTRSPDRAATEDERKTFENQVGNHAIPSKQVGDVDKSKLPGLEALSNPGRKRDKAQLLCKPNQVIMVRNGEMVEAHQWSDAEKTWQKIGEVVDAIGQDRRQIFNGREYDYVFDIDIGSGVMLKLPYNVSENPYAAAQQFIYDNELPQDFLDQIANFITQNAKGAEIGTSAYANVDPFTGGSRYVPNQPAGNVPPPPVTAPKSLPSLLPVRDYANFKGINANAVKTKLLQFNSEVGAEGAATLSPDQLSALDEFSQPFIAGLIAASGISESYEPGKNDVNIMLGFRALTNCFNTQKGKEAIKGAHSQAISALSKGFDKSTNDNLRLAFSTFVLNFIVLLKESGDDRYNIDLLELLKKFMSSESKDDTQMRYLAALGTLISGDDICKEASQHLNIPQALNSFNPQTPASKELVGAVKKILS